MWKLATKCTRSSKMPGNMAQGIAIVKTRCKRSAQVRGQGAGAMQICRPMPSKRVGGITTVHALLHATSYARGSRLRASIPNIECHHSSYEITHRLHEGAGEDAAKLNTPPSVEAPLHSLPLCVAHCLQPIAAAAHGSE